MRVLSIIFFVFFITIAHAQSDTLRIMGYKSINAFERHESDLRRSVFRYRYKFPDRKLRIDGIYYVLDDRKQAVCFEFKKPVSIDRSGWHLGEDTRLTSNLSKRLKRRRCKSVVIVSYDWSD